VGAVRARRQKKNFSRPTTWKRGIGQKVGALLYGQVGTTRGGGKKGTFNKKRGRHIGGQGKKRKKKNLNLTGKNWKR